MVVSNKPFTRGARIVVAGIALLWLAAGVIAVVNALKGGHLLLGILGLLSLGIGIIYALAAWRGRPWHWKGG